MEERDIPKTIKKTMRSLVGRAHEVELGKALEELFGEFQTWKSGAIDSLSYPIGFTNFTTDQTVRFIFVIRAGSILDSWFTTLWRKA